MLKKELILRNPLQLLGQATENSLKKGGFGIVLARAGVGKTSLMVQIALNSLLRNKNVLHISLTDPVNKVCLWYEEIFRNIAKFYDTKLLDPVWEDILTHRFIMTFRADAFSVPKLEERIGDLAEQGIFFPQLLIIDGFPFHQSPKPALAGLKALSGEYKTHVWFTMITHRHDTHTAEGMPERYRHLTDHFDIIIGLQPDMDQIHVKALKGGGPDQPASALLLDPSTMLVNKKQ
jgi:hypothetical protein